MIAGIMTDQQDHSEMMRDMQCARVLIIDDEEILQDVLSEVMNMLEIPSVAFESGAKGIDYYRDHRSEVELVLLDLMMPGMGGKETFQQLKQIDPEVKVIFMSGFTEEDEILSDDIENGRSFIKKPFSVEEIRTKVLKMLD